MAYGNGTNTPNGLVPRVYQNGTLWTSQFNQYPIKSGYAANIFTYDPVYLLSDGTIGIATAGNPMTGVFIGCFYQDANGNYQYSRYWPASTTTWNPGGTGNVNAVAFVVDDPNVLFDIQCAGTATVTGNVNTIKQNDINYNYNFHSGTGSTGTGLSGYYLDMATQATTSSLNLKLVRLAPEITNALGVLYNNGLVRINNHSNANQTDGV